MLKNHFIAVIFLLLLGLLQAVPVRAGYAFQAMPTKDYHADRFDVAIAVQNDGSLIVTETTVFRFIGGPFTFVYRTIPTDETDTITIRSASLDDQTMTQGTNAGQIEMEGTNPIKLTWHFAPTSDQVHTFVLTYRVQGVVRKEPDADALYWEAFPTQHEYPIRSSTITITYAQRIALLGEPEVRRGNASVMASPGKVVFSASNLSPNTPLEIGLRFHPGDLIMQPPLWQQAQERTSALLIPLLALGVLISLLGIWLLILYYQKVNRRSITLELPENARLTEPAGGLPPALAGVLIGAPSISPGWNHALATLFALAEKGVLNITESISPQKWPRAHPHSSYQIELREQPTNLLPHECGLLAVLFPEQKSSTLNIAHLGRTYKRRARNFTTPVKQELAEMGLLDVRRQQVGKRLGTISLCLFLVSLLGVIGTLCVGGSLGTWPIVFPWVGLMIMSLVAWFLWTRYSRLSIQGAQEARRWNAFSNYLGDISSGEQPIASPALFEQYLSYATSFGLLANWINRFQNAGQIAVPPWFGTLATSPDEHYTSFTRMMVHTSMINTSNSSGSGGGGGGGGVAGGGSSGAG